MKHFLTTVVFSLMLSLSNLALSANPNEPYFEYKIKHSRLEKIHVTRNVLTIYSEIAEAWDAPELYVIMTEFLDFYSDRPDQYQFIGRSHPEHDGLHPNFDEIDNRHYHISHLNVQSIDLECFQFAMYGLVRSCYLSEEAAYQAILEFSTSEYLEQTSSQIDP